MADMQQCIGRQSWATSMDNSCTWRKYWSSTTSNSGKTSHLFCFAYMCMDRCMTCTPQREHHTLKPPVLADVDLAMTDLWVSVPSHRLWKSGMINPCNGFAVQVSILMNMKAIFFRSRIKVKMHWSNLILCYNGLHLELDCLHDEQN